jgi:repressor of nif and glnA expression
MGDFMRTNLEFEILNSINNAGEAVGSRIIAQKLEEHGINLSERSVRYHLKFLDLRGFTKLDGRDGRLLTKKGKEEILNAFVTKKVGFVINKIDTLTYKMDFDFRKKKGKVIINASFIPKENFKSALKAMKPVYQANLCTSSFVALAKEGQKLGDVTVPTGMIGFGTLCSVTLNGIFLKNFIPLESKFGGLLQISKNKPIRFTQIINYDGSTLDPSEIFIKGKMTDVANAAKKGSGIVVAGFRSFPAVSLNAVENILNKLKDIGFNGLASVGRPGQPLLDIPVDSDRCGMVIIGGITPVAAVEEAGILTQNFAISTLHEFSSLISFFDL